MPNWLLNVRYLLLPFPNEVSTFLMYHLKLVSAEEAVLASLGKDSEKGLMK